MIKKRLTLFIVLLLLVLPLFGCKDKKEIEEQAFVSVIGLDKGQDYNFSITFQMVNANYGAGSGKSGGDGSEHKTETITFNAPDIISARDLANISVSRRITLAHAKVLVVGEELAREDKFFQRLQATLRERELRRGIELIISKEKAADFIRDNNPKLESRINKFYDFMAQRWKETGLVPVSNVNKFMQRVEEDKSLFLAAYGSTRKTVPKLKGGYEADYKPGEVDMVGGNPTELIGSAVFKSGKMIGSLTGEETRIISLLRAKPETKTMIFTIPDPLDKEYRVTLRLIRYEKNKISIDISNGGAVIYVKVPLVIEVLSIPSLKNYVDNLKAQKLLKQHIRNYLIEKSENLVKKTKTEFTAEPFLWELEVRKDFATYQEYAKYNWAKEYTSSDINIDFDLEIKRFGKQLAPPKLPRGKEDKES